MPGWVTARRYAEKCEERHAEKYTERRVREDPSLLFWAHRADDWCDARRRATGRHLDTGISTPDQRLPIVSLSKLSLRRLVGAVAVIAVVVTSAVVITPSRATSVETIGQHGVSTLLACPGAHLCVAAGVFTDPFGRREVYTTTSSTGRHWSAPLTIESLEKYNQGDFTQVNALTCPSPASCVLGGVYAALAPSSTGPQQAYDAFLTDWNGSAWRAQRLRGLGPTTPGHATQVLSVSCPSAHECTAVGVYNPTRATTSGFLVTRRHGHWSSAEVVPGLDRLSVSGDAVAHAVSCAAPGTCVVVGTYRDASGHSQGFWAYQRAGVWHITVPTEAHCRPTSSTGDTVRPMTTLRTGGPTRSSQT
jgi:hypothetical protein